MNFQLVAVSTFYQVWYKFCENPGLDGHKLTFREKTFMLKKLKNYVYNQYPPLSVASNYLSLARDMKRFGVKLTPYGFKFIGPKELQDGLYEPDETKLIQSYLKKSTVFVDIGANMGYYSCLGRFAGLKVIAIEPLLFNLEYLYANLETNGYYDVEVFPLGLAANTGLAILFGPGTAASLIQDWSGKSTKKRIVPLSTLDVIIGDRFADEKLLIKIDVEGAEFEVVKGTNNILTTFPESVWIVEILLSGNIQKGLIQTFSKPSRNFGVMDMRLSLSVKIAGWCHDMMF